MQDRRHNHNADSSSGSSGNRGIRGGAEKLASKAHHGMLVLWQKGPQGERVLEKACPIRINLDRAKSSMGIDSSCTTSRAPKEPEIDWDQPS